MPIRSACLALLVATLPSALHGQGGGAGRIIDEGTFTVTKSGAPSIAESFRITRMEGPLVQATAQSSAGARRITSRLITDTTGLPTDYGLVVLDGRDTSFKVRVAGSGGRLSATSSNRRGDESMREYPSAGATIIVDDDLVHHGVLRRDQQAHGKRSPDQSTIRHDGDRDSELAGPGADRHRRAVDDGDPLCDDRGPGSAGTSG